VTAGWAGTPRPLARHALGIARRGPRAALAVAARETRLTLSARRLEAALRAEAGTARPILAGPFLGEVGFELLYWIPLLRALLERERIDPERVTVLTRGGAGAWYADLAARSMEIFDLVPPEELRPRLSERRRVAGDQKQRTVEPLDRELVGAAGVPDALVLHPLLMYAGLRLVHAGRRPVRTLTSRLRFRELARADVDLPDLPQRYAAVRFYDSASFPLDRAAGVAEAAVARLAERIAVVVVVPARQLDDHAAWRPAIARQNVTVVTVDDPHTSLAVQTEIVRGAAALVCTAGGFSYLGPLTGTPTLALGASAANPVHLATLEQAFPAAAYSALPTTADLEPALTDLLAR
jgi:hypothetical protein